MGFYGDLVDLPLADILYVLSSHGSSGRLTLSIPGDEITLVFDRGHVASVTTTDANLRIGRLLVDQGYVTEDQMEQALALQAVELDRTRIGDVLVELGFVNSRQITRAVAAQLEASLFRILIQPGGSFVYTPQESYVEEPLVDEIPIEPIVLDAIRRADEWLATNGRQEAVSLADVPFREGVLEGLESVEHETLLAIVNGAFTPADIAARIGSSSEEVDEILGRLAALGLVVRAGKTDPANHPAG
ncbi:MAG TPA: DUF4388 domain-containing protein [Thermomicrobiaceae bacterium]|nr:DUF4388 domain-containing protein [Thermomicrobiaceae bacterium]